MQNKNIVSILTVVLSLTVLPINAMMQREWPERSSLKIPVDKCSYSDSLLYEAVKKGLTDEVRYLLDNGYSVIDRNFAGDTPLHVASRYGHLDIVRICLGHKADVNMPNFRTYYTPLHVAAENGHPEIVRRLIQAGAAINVRSKGVFEFTPLHLAVLNRHNGAVEVLAGYEGVSDQGDSQSRSALHMAVDEGFLEIVQTFIQNRSNLEIRDRYGRTPLHRGVQFSHIIEALLQAGAVVDAQDYQGETALCNAVACGARESVEILIRNHANVNKVSLARRTMGMMPLHYAAQLEYGHDIALLLINNGAQINRTDDKGNTPLHYASQHGGNKTVLLLIQNSADVNARNTKGQTNLHLAAEWGQEKVALTLIEYHADVNVQDNLGKTPLHIAAEKSHIPVMCQWGFAVNEPDNHVVEILAQHGADVNRQDRDGNTPLHLVIQNGNMRDIEALLANGANVTLRNKAGQTPLQVQDRHGNSILHWAAQNGKIQVIEMLIASGADVSLRNNAGQTPSQEAEAAHHISCRDLIRQNERYCTIA